MNCPHTHPQDEENPNFGIRENEILDFLDNVDYLNMLIGLVNSEIEKVSDKWDRLVEKAERLEKLLEESRSARLRFRPETTD